jgi:predicted O-methyltransferase YrrM
MQFSGWFRDPRVYRNPTARSVYRGVRRGFSRAGLDVVVKSFYSPIPDVAALPIDTFTKVSEMPGISWDLDAQLDFVRGTLGEAMMEFDPPAERGDPPRYVPDPAYSPADATVLYAMVRSLRPRRIVELGSGQSTLVMAEAVRANRAEGSEAELTAFDPYPGLASRGLPGLARLERLNAQDVPLETFERLGAGDFLFVDTTHTVKIGSDVNFILLEVLPRLAPGVVVHLHDIFLPYEYPKSWLEDYALYWSEQYLVQAFLAFNTGYEVLASVHALQRERLPAVRPLLPAAAGNWPGAALWLRRRGEAEGRSRADE